MSMLLCAFRQGCGRVVAVAIVVVDGVMDGAFVGGIRGPILVINSMFVQTNGVTVGIAAGVSFAAGGAGGGAVNNVVATI